VLEADRRGFRAPGTTFMVAGGLIGAVGAYLFQAYGGRQLGTEAFAPVGQLWTVFFILATVLLVPVEQYITREVAVGRKVIPGDLVPAMAVAGIGALVGGGFVLITLDRLFAGSFLYLVQILLLMVGYGLLVVGKGVYAGRRLFAKVGWVLIVETAVRLVAGIVVIQLVGTAESLGWAMVLGGFAVLGMGWWRHDRGTTRPPAAPPTRFLGGYVGGTASAQVLLGAAPVVVALLGGDEAIQSIVFATFTLFRAPLTLIFALQGRVLPYLVGMADSGDRKGLAQIARLVVIGGVILAGLGALVGWLVGPEVVSLLFIPEFAPSATVAALTAAGMMAAATAQIAGQVLVAEGRTSRLSVAWVAGLIVAIVAIVLFQVDPDVRVALAFLVGETVALVTMAFLSTGRPILK
jgi:O-antigen/teichoic acid export membrane protein